MAAIWIGIAVGFLTSVLANSITTGWYRCSEKKRLAKKFAWVAGNFVGYVKIKGTDNLDVTKEKSSATVTYLRDNILKIEVNGADKVPWSGEIAMDGEQSGSVIFRCDFKDEGDLTKRRHRFGLKRAIFVHEKIPEALTMYLVGDKSEGFDNEVFTRTDFD